MTTISDEFMRDMLVKTKPYTLVLLRATPKHDEPGMDAVVWEHGRRNFSLRADGALAIVCPVRLLTSSSDNLGSLTGKI